MSLTAAQVRQYASNAGFSGTGLDYIVAIANRESGFNPDAYNGNENTGDNSVGLVQINMIGDLGASRLNEINRVFGTDLQSVDQAKQWLKDPSNNLRYAYYISNQGTNFQPWTTAGAAANDIGLNNGRASTADGITFTGAGGQTVAGSTVTPAGGFDIGSIIKWVNARVPQVDPNSFAAWLKDNSWAQTLQPEAQVRAMLQMQGIDPDSVLGALPSTSNPDNAASTAERKYEFDNISAYQQAQIEIATAQNQFDNAQKVGDAAAAARAQESLDYWKGIAAGQQGDANALTARGQDIGSADSQYSTQMQKYDSDQRYQVSMAAATTDQQRMQIEAQHNAELAAIAQMQDYRTGQSNQTDQFGAETSRATGMGQLQLDTNKFLGDYASGARGSDLFSLYFLERGMNPDFNAMAAGQPLATGAGIKPGDPMKAYTPTTAAPDFTKPNPYTDKVGQASAAGVAVSQQPNSFIGPSTAVAPTPPPAAPAFTPSAPVQSPQAAQQQAQMAYSGVRNEDVAGLGVGQSKQVTTGGAGTSNVADYQHDGYGYHVFDTNGNPVTGDIAPGTAITVTRYPMGGYTTARKIMTGDSPHPNPAAGGARPEVVENPTGAPLIVRPNAQSYHDLGVAAPAQSVPGSTFGTGPSMAEHFGPMTWESAQAMFPHFRSAGGGGGSRRAGSPYTQMGASPAQQYGQWTQGGPGNGTDPHAAMAANNGPATGQAAAMAQMTPADMMATIARAQAAGAVRYALGTGVDNSQAFQDAGIGSAWIPSSNNSAYAGTNLPPRLQALAQYGFPLTPGMVNSTTGQVMPQMNIGYAFNQRGMGVAPSLQTINHMSPGEQEAEKGLVEGVGKLSWRDVINGLAAPTQNLATATRAKAS